MEKIKKLKPDWRSAITYLLAFLAAGTGEIGLMAIDGGGSIPILLDLMEGVNSMNIDVQTFLDTINFNKETLSENEDLGAIYENLKDSKPLPEHLEGRYDIIENNFGEVYSHMTTKELTELSNKVLLAFSVVSERNEQLKQENTEMKGKLIHFERFTKGEHTKDKANKFAQEMLQYLNEAEAKGFKTFQKKADYLNAKNIKTARGKKFYAGTVQKLVKRLSSIGMAETYGEKTSMADEFAKKRLHSLLEAQSKRIYKLASIADYFNEQGLETPRGAKYTASSISVLKSRLEKLGCLEPTEDTSHDNKVLVIKRTNVANSPPDDINTINEYTHRLIK